MLSSDDRLAFVVLVLAFAIAWFSTWIAVAVAVLPIWHICLQQTQGLDHIASAAGRTSKIFVRRRLLHYGSLTLVVSAFGICHFNYWLGLTVAAIPLFGLLALPLSVIFLFMVDARLGFTALALLIASLVYVFIREWRESRRGPTEYRITFTPRPDGTMERHEEIWEQDTGGNWIRRK